MSGGKFFIGLLLLLATAGIIWYFSQDNQPAGEGRHQPGDPLTTVSIRYGSEKKGLLGDEEFVKIMADKYGLHIDGTKMGSLELSEGALTDVDGLWPSSELAALVFEDRHPGLAHKKQIIFNSPIVFYSWAEVVDVLRKEGVVTRKDERYFALDSKALFQLILDRKDWGEIGLNDQIGKIVIRSTDPTKSNSGFLMAGLLAIMLNGGNQVDDRSVQPLLPTIDEIYTSMGYLENSTGILFRKYLEQGRGAFPLIAAYESLVIEYYIQDRYRDAVKQYIQVLIPEPTVWSEHPFISLTPAGEQLQKALQDERVLEIAWERYGFRSGVLGTGSGQKVLEEIGLPVRIVSVTPLPSPSVMTTIVETISR